MSRLEKAYGSNDPKTLFGDAPMTSAPWPRAGRRKDKKDYDQEKVHHALLNPDQYPKQPLDPRTLHATQPNITRQGVSHYLEDSSGKTFADQGNIGNKTPMVYDREGTQMILSGHHRAATALLRGEQFDAVVVKGGWGPAR